MDKPAGQGRSSGGRLCGGVEAEEAEDVGRSDTTKLSLAWSGGRCSNLSVDVARDAIQAFGGYGFIYEGATEIQKWLIARQIFGRDITG